MLAGIDAAVHAGLDPVKVNAVVMRGINDAEVVDLARFGREKGVGVRFIEFMPLDAQGQWSRDKVVPAAEILERIDAVFPLEAAGTDGPEPASRFVYRDGIGDVGVIASVSEPFCADCDRVRITAEGQFRTCLFALEEFDLRAELRADGGLEATDLDDRLAAVITGAVAHKVGRPPHRRRRFRAPRALDEPNRGLKVGFSSRPAGFSPCAPTLSAHGFGVHAPRPARTGPNGRCHREGAVPPTRRRPLSGPHGSRDRIEDRQRGDQQG